MYVIYYLVHVMMFVCHRERERKSVCQSACVCLCVCVCVCSHACVCVCVCVCERDIVIMIDCGGGGVCVCVYIYGSFSEAGPSKAQGVTYLQRKNKCYVSHYQLLLAVRVQLR